MDKKVSIFIGAIVFLISAYFSYSYFSNSESSIKNPLGGYSKPDSNGQTTDLADTDPKTEECPINGQLLTKKQRDAWEARRPMGIMVENSTDARPQSGLSSADVIYEAVAEGGITRFLTIFYCKDANPVGPVRSARVYFLNLLQEYADYPLYAHVGGANTDGPADALGEIANLGWASYNDLNQFSVPFPNFWRDYERLPDRATEHTVYTATKKLFDYARDKRKLTNVDEEGNAWDKDFEKWKFKDDAPLAQRGDLQKISFGFWSSFADQYNVIWTYDKTTNSFKRENGGQPHMDKDTGKQMEAKNVIITFMVETPANDGYEGGQHILYKTKGTGDAIIFQDGIATKGTWQKTDLKSRMKFYNDSGTEMSIVRGQVFVEILPIGNKVVY